MSVRTGLASVFEKVVRLSAVHTRLIEKHMAELCQLVGHRGLVIDVGAGNEPYRKLIDCDRYISTDINSDSKVDIITDICRLPLEDGAADTFICTEVLEHVPNSNMALREVRRVLAKDGYMILTSPLLWGVHDRVDYYRWTEAGLHKLLEKNGFAALQIKKQGGIFSVAAELFRQIPAQSGGPYSITSSNLPKYGLLLLGYLLLIPFTRMVSLLDVFDKKRDFTLGYSVLAHKC